MRIIDNFLSDFVHQRICNEVINNQYFPFYYHNFVTNNNEKDKNDVKQLCFVHTLYSENSIKSNYHFPIIGLPLIDKLEIADGNLIRIKINLNVNQSEHIISDWHTDNTNSHTTALYYLNTNNGYTEFKDGTKIESVANRVIIFDGLLEHRGVTQTDTKGRFAININYI